VKSKVRVRLLALALIALASFAAVPKYSKQRIEWNQPIAPFHIIANVYFVGTAQLGCYLIATPAGDILIDGALPESAPRIERNIATLGFRMHDIKFLLNTHAHYDHAGGLPELKRASGALMIASAGDAPNLRSGLTDSFGAGWDQRVPGVAVDRIVRDGGQVALGGSVLTAHIMPGHTRGCTTWTMDVNEAGKTQHVLFYCSTSVPGYKLVNNPVYPGIAADYERSFAIAERLRCDVFLANHTGFFHMREKLARVSAGGANPFIDPDEYRTFVRQSRSDFETELARQRTVH
jgi:metallo-beta-lactamase class B